MPPAPRAARAIANPSGVTCYLGSAVQAIAHSPPFVRSLLTTPLGAVSCPNSRRRRGEEEDRAIALALRRLVTTMWARAGDAIDPSDLLKVIAPRLGRQGAGRALEQHDAHEAMAIMLNALVDLRPEFRSVLEGRLQQLVRCEVCGSETTRSEPFTQISLHVPHADADAGDGGCCTSGLLGAFQAPERVRGFHCDRCGRRDATAARMVRLEKLPDVLVLLCCRLEGRTEVRPDESFVFATLSDSTRRHYRLVSVVCHSGSSRSGHYVTIARRPGSASWDVHDDERVREVVGGDACPRRSWRAGYVYVYSAT